MHEINIILSPHFDDAVFSLGGLLAQEGQSSVVSTFFAGTPATAHRTRWDSDCGFASSNQAMRARAKENNQALALLGIPKKNVRNYSYLDRQYVIYRDRATLTSVEGDIQNVLEEYKGSKVKIFGPGLDMHPDHELVRSALLSVFRQHQQRDVAFFLFQDLPYSYWFLRNAAQGISAGWDYGLLKSEIAHRTCSVETQIISLSDKDIEIKTKSAKQYASQIKPLGADLLPSLAQFAAGQARSLRIAAEYCEVVYRLVK